MEIIFYPPDEIHPDPKQPRSVIDEKLIKDLAKAIKTEGIINPIEIDPTLMIVTGEVRWRASIMAGMKEIPCKMIDVPTESRFRRQVIENLHHNTMNQMDTSRAVEKLLKERGWKSDFTRPTVGPMKVNVQKGKEGFVSVGNEEIINKFAEEVGKSRSWVYEQLKYLNEPKDVQEYIESEEGKPSLIREVNKAPEDVRAELKRKVTSKEINDRETVNEMIRALKRDPEKQKELLALDLSGKMADNLHKIHQISPPVKEAEEGRLVGEAVHDAMNAIDGMYQKTLNLMDEVDLDNAPMSTVKMLYTNGNMFRNGFEIFQAKLVAMIEQSDKKQLKGETE